jgi:hypothetical protein
VKGCAGTAWPQLLQNLDPKFNSLPHAVQFIWFLLLLRDVSYADSCDLVPSCADAES